MIPKLKTRPRFSTTDSATPASGDGMLSWLDRAIPLWVRSDGKKWDGLGDW